MSSSQKRVVIKLGSGILSRDDGIGLDDARISRLVEEIAGLRKSGYEVVVVSSGAVAAGMMCFRLDARPEDVATLQAYAAVGQTRLMHFYETLFRQFDIKVAQMLLTHEDMREAPRRLNLKNTLNRLITFEDVVTIINENDSVAVEELRFGDNDELSADVAILAKADLLILLTTVDGLLDPKTGDLVREVARVNDVFHMPTGDKGTFGKGGMGTKLQAVSTAVSHGIETIIAGGRKPEQLPALVAGGGSDTLRTRFAPNPPTH